MKKTIIGIVAATIAAIAAITGGMATRGQDTRPYEHISAYDVDAKSAVVVQLEPCDDSDTLITAVDVDGRWWSFWGSSFSLNGGEDVSLGDGFDLLVWNKGTDDPADDELFNWMPTNHKYFDLLTDVSTAAPDISGLYAASAKVVGLDYETDTVTFANIYGSCWEWSGCEDWGIDDGAALLMWENGTAAIKDDIILRAISQ